MPTSSVKNIILGSILAVVTSTAVLTTLNMLNKKTRSLPSTFENINKPPLLQSEFTSKGVSNRILKVKIKFDEAQTDSESVQLQAHITVPFDFNSPLKFKWKIGENVTVVEGLTSGDVLSLRKEEECIIYLTVKGFSKEKNHHIGFEIFGSLNGRRVHGDTLVASDLENTFENTVQNVERIKASQ